MRVAAHVAEISAISLDIDHNLHHGASFGVHGVICTSWVLEKAYATDAVLVGAVGGPKWDDVRLPCGAECQDGLMFLRHRLQTCLGLRPARAWDDLLELTPLCPDIVAGADILVLREMCGGAMFAGERGQRKIEGKRQAHDLTAYDEGEIARLARF